MCAARPAGPSSRLATTIAPKNVPCRRNAPREHGRAVRHERRARGVGVELEFSLSARSAAAVGTREKEKEKEAITGSLASEPSGGSAATSAAPAAALARAHAAYANPIHAKQLASVSASATAAATAAASASARHTLSAVAACTRPYPPRHPLAAFAAHCAARRRGAHEEVRAGVPGHLGRGAEQRKQGVPQREERRRGDAAAHQRGEERHPDLAGGLAVPPGAHALTHLRGHPVNEKIKHDAPERSGGDDRAERCL